MVCIFSLPQAPVFGLLGIFAIFEKDWKMMIVWMVVAMLVDGFDGTLARWADVKKYANGVDGALLDNILDYLNYVMVPALFSWSRPICCLSQSSAPAGFRSHIANFSLSIHTDRCQD
ncbi:MAG: CDP-alcohol phosphatidyltransferase family protein [Giesbergeria sp.]